MRFFVFIPDVGKGVILGMERILLLRGFLRGLRLGLLSVVNGSEKVKRIRSREEVEGGKD